MGGKIHILTTEGVASTLAPPLRNSYCPHFLPAHIVLHIIVTRLGTTSTYSRTIVLSRVFASSISSPRRSRVSTNFRCVSVCACANEGSTLKYISGVRPRDPNYYVFVVSTWHIKEAALLLLKKSLFSQQLCSAMENYEILRKLGAGNFAKVYLALHTPTGRKVSREKNPTCV